MLQFIIYLLTGASEEFSMEAGKGLIPGTCSYLNYTLISVCIFSTLFTIPEVLTKKICSAIKIFSFILLSFMIDPGCDIVRRNEMLVTLEG